MTDLTKHTVLKNKKCPLCLHQYPPTDSYWYNDNYKPNRCDTYCIRCRRLKEFYKSKHKDAGLKFPETISGLRTLLLSQGHKLEKWAIESFSFEELMREEASKEDIFRVELNDLLKRHSYKVQAMRVAPDRVGYDVRIRFTMVDI